MERKKIAAAMKRQGRKWVWLCAATSYSRTHVAQMMSGHEPMSPKFVKLAHNALGIPEDATSLVA